MTSTNLCDVVVIGGGPAGLAFVRALAGSGLSVVLVERQPHEAIAIPAEDGREIALTHRSADTLRALDAWHHIDPAAIAPLREAQVLDGRSPFALAFDPGRSGADRLGQLVPNHLIRRALFAATATLPGLELVTGATVTSITTDDRAATVTLADGRTIRARLLVGADSRFSAVRQQLGITAQVNRLGRAMLLARVAHTADHRAIATEWFDHGQTIALLPLPGRQSSFVLTVAEDDAARLAALDRDALSRELTRRAADRLGPMTVTGGPHVYPLATVWSDHFAARRAALIGDAAVGMHPVTAHGFNLGLASATSLAALVRRAAERGRDIAAPSLLRRYEAAHRLAAGPLFAATALIVRLYTDDSLAARVARPALLRAAARLTPVRAGVSRLLMRH